VQKTTSGLTLIAREYVFMCSYRNAWRHLDPEPLIFHKIWRVARETRRDGRKPLRKITNPESVSDNDVKWIHIKIFLVFRFSSLLFGLQGISFISFTWHQKHSHETWRATEKSVSQRTGWGKWKICRIHVIKSGIQN